MRKLLLTLITLVSFSFMASAQFGKGSVLLGGQLSYNSSESPFYPGSDQSYTHSGNFGVSVGKAVSENAVLGINLNFSPYSTNSYYSNTNNLLEYSYNTYSAGVFYRVYKTLGKEFYLFGEAGAAYIGMHSTSKDVSNQISASGSSNGASAYFMPGIAYKISKNFFLDLSIPNVFNFYYLGGSASNSYGGHTSTVSVSTSLSSNPLNALSIGFRLNL